MNANIGRKSTSMQDLLKYHVGEDVSRELEHSKDRQPTTESTDRLTRLVAGFREAGISEHAIHVLRLVPVIHIAWSDAPPQAEQRKAILKTACEHGVRPGMIAYKLLEIWLSARPDASMFGLWCDYVGALRWAMTDDSYEQLKHESVHQASATANAMQTCLSTLLDREPQQAAINQIAAAFGT